MSLDTMARTLETVLRALLWIVAGGIIGGAAAIILTMDPASAAQGGRFYVAVIAIVALAAVDHQLRRLLRRRLPFSLTTQPEERRYNRNSYVLLALASALLLGLAFYTGGTSHGVDRLVAYVLLLAAVPFTAIYLLQRLVKPVFDRGIDRLFGDHDPGVTTQRTFTFSVGSAPTESATPTSAGEAGVSRRESSRELAMLYRDRWQQIRAGFSHDPEQAVRDAHALVLRLRDETGASGAMVFDEQFAASDTSDAAALLRLIGERVRDARAAERAVRSALKYESADATALAKAMDAYERTLLHVLMRTDA
jgi:hypothetical protein